MWGRDFFFFWYNIVLLCVKSSHALVSNTETAVAVASFSNEPNLTCVSSPSPSLRPTRYDDSHTHNSHIGSMMIEAAHFFSSSFSQRLLNIFCFFAQSSQHTELSAVREKSFSVLRSDGSAWFNNFFFLILPQSAREIDVSLEDVSKLRIRAANFEGQHRLLILECVTISSLNYEKFRAWFATEQASREREVH